MAADGPPARVLLADRGYDSDAIRQDMEARGGVAVIPARRTRKVRESVDAHIYALRNRIERCFNRLKNARRVATRYDKTADSYRGFVQIASIRLWIRDFVNTPYERSASVALPQSRTKSPITLTPSLAWRDGSGKRAD